MEKNEINRFDSIKLAAKSINLSRHSITKACNGINNTAGGFVWKYLDKKKEVNFKLMKEIKDYPYLIDKSGNIYSLKIKKY